MANKGKNTTDKFEFSSNVVKFEDEEFKRVIGYVYNTIGINLTEKKRNLVTARLQKVLRARKFTNFRDYYDALVADKSGEMLSELANNISTNHTFFYRENAHFDFFYERTLPEIEERLKANNSNDIRVWSAGCSSGEEPYMLIMLMKEYFVDDYARLDAGVLATDISQNALRFAKRGVYPKDRLKYMPDKYRKKYFKKLSKEESRVIDEIMKEVTYRRFNLMNKTFPFKKPFDAIFCRNVMIYFDEKTKAELARKFYDSIVPGGYLFIGHSESINRVEGCRFKYIQPALYRKL